MYCGSDDLFLEHPCAREQNVTMALNKVNCSLWFKVPFLLSAQSFDFWTSCKMTSPRLSFIIGFLAFPDC